MEPHRAASQEEFLDEVMWGQPCTAQLLRKPGNPRFGGSLPDSAPPGPSSHQLVFFKHLFIDLFISLHQILVATCGILVVANRLSSCGT